MVRVMAIMATTVRATVTIIAIMVRVMAIISPTTLTKVTMATGVGRKISNGC